MAASPPSDPPPIGPRDQRIVKHLKAISEAGEDPSAFANALRAFRDDAALSLPQREAIFKTLAQDAVLAYYALATGAPLNIQSLLAAAPPRSEDS